MAWTPRIIEGGQRKLEVIEGGRSGENTSKPKRALRGTDSKEVFVLTRDGFQQGDPALAEVLWNFLDLKK